MSSLWGIVPAAGSGTRIQPLAFSKELLPVGSFTQEHIERPRAISEYLLDRMLIAGVHKICMVISPGKSDIMRYYGSGIGAARFCYTVQQHSSGLCDAIFTVVPFIGPEDRVIIGLPDTVWFPSDGLTRLPDNILSLLLFPVKHPEFYDAVETDRSDRVIKIRVKEPPGTTSWIWGAIKMPGIVLHDLARLWTSRGKVDEYIGTLINVWLKEGGEAVGIKAGEHYVDVGTLNGYREAMKLLSKRSEIESLS